jgi:hypothetical protein
LDDGSNAKNQGNPLKKEEEKQKQKKKPPKEISKSILNE